MKVLLKVTVTTEYDVVTDCTESLEEAKEYFDPCEDLQGAEQTYSNAEVTDAIEIYDCPECKGRGVLIENKEFKGTCKRCFGNGYLRVVKCG